MKISIPQGMSEGAAKRHVANQICREPEPADLEPSLQEGEATIAGLRPSLENAQAAGKKNAADAGQGRVGQP